MGDTSFVQCERTLVASCKSLYKGHSACVQVGGGMSPWFDIQSGIKQGCVMSAWLFDLYMDCCLQGMKQNDRRVKVGALRVKCLLYADDAVLIASSECELQALVITLKIGCKNES